MIPQRHVTPHGADEGPAVDVSPLVHYQAATGLNDRDAGTGAVDVLQYPGNIHGFNEAPAACGSMPQRARIVDDDFATIMYTSGSTGKSKGVIQTHSNLVEGAEIVSRYLNNVPADHVLCLLPLSFDYGLNQLLSAVYTGFRLTLGN